MDREEFQKAYGKVVAKAWADPDFKAKLLADPRTVLKENGVAIPEDVEYRVVENTDQVVHLILPAAPSGQLSEEALETLAGGGRIAGIDLPGIFRCLKFNREDVRIKKTTQQHPTAGAPKFAAQAPDVFMAGRS